jgi:hypothetical protein
VVSETIAPSDLVVDDIVTKSGGGDARGEDEINNLNMPTGNDVYCQKLKNH